MVTEYVIWYSKQAKEDLKSIFLYIKNTENHARAQYILNGITKSVESIIIFPLKHRIEPLFNNANIRFAVKWKYKIIFRINNSQIEILRVFHSSQDPQKMNNSKK